MTDDQDGSRRPDNRGRIIGFTIFGIVLVLLVAAVWVAFRALTVKGELENAVEVVDELRDGAELAQSLAELSSSASIAAEAAGDPVWRVAEFVPFAGDNLRAVRLAADSLDMLVNRVAVPALADDGTDMSLMEAVLSISAEQGDAVADLAGQLDAVRDSPFLIGQVRNGVQQIGDVMDAAGPALQLLPVLLGAEEPKTYLMVFQNNAEALALGGSPASQTLIHVDAGSITMGTQADSGRYQNGTPVDVAVGDEALGLYGEYLTGHMNTSMMRPDFPTGAQILKAWWQRDIGADQIDGVISVNLLALERILVATGPVALPSGDELTADNAVDLLLSEVYARWDSYKYPELVDGFFASAANAVFDTVAAGAFNLKDMIWAIGESAAKGDILVWSEDQAVQDAVTGQRVSGALPADNDASTTVGVFYNSTSASKIDYYTHSQVDATSVCTDGERSTTVSSTLKLDLDQATADGLPRYVQSRDSGSSAFSTRVFVYGPVGSQITSATVDGQAAVVNDAATDLGRPVAVFDVVLAPTQQATVTATFAGAAEGGELALQTTPMIHPGKPVVQDSCNG